MCEILAGINDAGTDLLQCFDLDQRIARPGKMTAKRSGPTSCIHYGIILIGKRIPRIMDYPCLNLASRHGDFLALLWRGP